MSISHTEEELSCKGGLPRPESWLPCAFESTGAIGTLQRSVKPLLALCYSLKSTPTACFPAAIAVLTNCMINRTPEGTSAPQFTPFSGGHIEQDTPHFLLAHSGEDGLCLAGSACCLYDKHSEAVAAERG